MKSRSTPQGYGLAITKEMVEKLNGKITAQSTVEGTVFTVYFIKEKSLLTQGFLSRG